MIRIPALIAVPQIIFRHTAISWKYATNVRRRSKGGSGLVRQGVVYNNNPSGPIPLKTIEWNCEKCGAAFPNMIKAREHENQCVVTLEYKKSTLFVFTKSGMKLLGLLKGRRDKK